MNLVENAVTFGMRHIPLKFMVSSNILIGAEWHHSWLLFARRF